MSASSAFEVAAEYVERHSDELVSSWIDWVRSRVQTSAVTALPERALRNHVPPVLRSLAQYVKNPLHLAREELLGHLRLHAQIRRDQGYSMPEVLAEFDGLADLVSRGVHRAVLEGAPDATREELLEVSGRLATALRSVSFITVGTYTETDDERARALSTGLEEFSRAIAHELRGPLNTLGLSARLLRQEDLADEDRLAQAEVMEAAVRRADALLDTMHTLALAEGARTGSRMVVLAEVVTRVVQEFADEAQRAGVLVRVETPLPDVRVESTLCYVVLANTIGNAIKYHDAAKDERWVRVSAEIVEEEHDSGFCALAVEDNGLGIPEVLLPRVFQRGFRAHPEHAQGTGLGLSLVRQSVHSRGGSVDLRSEEGEGTTIVARIRCLQPSEGSLSAERFSVASLMGRRVADDVAGGAGPEVPRDEAGAE